jgi:MarR family transcriptional regulator for hemolysin
LSTNVDWKAERHITPRVIKQYLDKKMTARMESLGLQGSQGAYLMTVAEIPGASMKEVSAYMIVDKSITTRTMGALIDAGFVSNESRDARRYSLVLTEKGKDAVKVIEKISNEIWEELLSDLTEQELAAFKSALAKINAKFNEETD